MLNPGQALKNEKVLIHGASGGVGIAAMQVAQQLGLNVYGTAGSQAGLDLIKKHDAKAYNHQNQKYLDELKNEKFDLIIEMLANVNLAHDIEMLKPKGRIMVSEFSYLSIKGSDHAFPHFSSF